MRRSFQENGRAIICWTIEACEASVALALPVWLPSHAPQHWQSQCHIFGTSTFRGGSGLLRALVFPCSPVTCRCEYD